MAPTARYFALQVNVSAIDWSTAAFQTVQVPVNATVDGQVQSQRTLSWTKAGGVTDTQYLTWPVQAGKAVSYTWKANYITAGTGT